MGACPLDRLKHVVMKKIMVNKYIVFQLNKHKGTVFTV